MSLGSYYEIVWGRAWRDMVAFLKAQVLVGLVIAVVTAVVMGWANAGIGEAFNVPVAIYAAFMAAFAVALLAFTWNAVLIPWRLHEEQAARLHEFELRLEAGRAHRAALRAEIDVCKEVAERYRDARVAAPSYRLPTATYARSYHALLDNSALSEPQAKALLQFFSEVETLNRGLELVQAARGNAHKVEAEHGRNLLKVERLTELYGAARAAVDA